MTNVVIPNWVDLQGLVPRAVRRLTVFTPYYSAEGVQALQPLLRSRAAVTFWTRLDARAWVDGVVDPQALRDFLQFFESEGHRPDLRIQPLLHSKGYFADGHTGLVVSSNLSKSGFGGNVEILVELNGRVASHGLRLLQGACRRGSRHVPLTKLNDWIDRLTDAVARAKRDRRRDSRPLLSEESRTDKKLRVPDPLGLSAEELDRFVNWLSRHKSYPGSSDVVRLHRDKVRQRRQGHVKQSFAGVFRFLGENPRFISELASAPTSDCKARVVAPAEH
jgi:phosphatidylserine/phosphatidylglycerophosphate/cardiolipin synthase-like enzyme